MCGVQFIIFKHIWCHCKEGRQSSVNVFQKKRRKKSEGEKKKHWIYFSMLYDSFCIWNGQNAWGYPIDRPWADRYSNKPSLNQSSWTFDSSALIRGYLLFFYCASVFLRLFSTFPCKSLRWSRSCQHFRSDYSPSNNKSKNNYQHIFDDWSKIRGICCSSTVWVR